MVRKSLNAISSPKDEGAVRLTSFNTSVRFWFTWLAMVRSQRSHVFGVGSKDVSFNLWVGSPARQKHIPRTVLPIGK